MIVCFINTLLLHNQGLTVVLVPAAPKDLDNTFSYKYFKKYSYTLEIGPNTNIKHTPNYAQTKYSTHLTLVTKLVFYFKIRPF